LYFFFLLFRRAARFVVWMSAADDAEPALAAGIVPPHRLATRLLPMAKTAVTREHETRDRLSTL
jgi:hypothetical protein